MVPGWTELNLEDELVAAAKEERPRKEDSGVTSVWKPQGRAD